MSRVHYLNVGNGDCSIIQHATGHVSVIDVNLAKKIESNETLRALEKLLSNQPSSFSYNSKGNYNQKAHPDNPIEYMERHSVKNIFRFILTHPDSDHFGGIKNLFETHKVFNFWDIENDKSGDGDDWNFYEQIKLGKHTKRLNYLEGQKNKFFNISEDGESGGDGLHIMSPTAELVSNAHETKEYNDASYVILYKVKGFKILFGGDAHDETWKSIMKLHKDEVANVDILIAPHHGRDSGCDFSFLDLLKPKLTLFGNASSEHLAYDVWNSKNLEHITNNEAGAIILDITNESIDIFVTNEKYANDENKDTYFDSRIQGFYIGSITSD
jgi:beta-lactamase superfamily II metal-dependent hydrolase